MFATYLTAGLCVWLIAVTFALAFIRGANPPERDRTKQLEVQS